jgi:hypothetical protein
MSTIVNNLTISGYKAFGLDGNAPTDFINNTIKASDGNIYNYQQSNITETQLTNRGLSKTIYLDGSTAGTRGGARTVDTLSVMISTADLGATVLINGYVATRGVGNANPGTVGGAVINWAVWPSQSTGGVPTIPAGTPVATPYGNYPAYTVTPGSPGTAPNTLTEVLLSGQYNSNNALNVSEGTNNLVIEIISTVGSVTTRTVLTYYVVIVSSSTRLSSLIPTLSPNVLVPGYSYSPAFDSNYNANTSQTYRLNVNPLSTTMTLTPTTAVAGTDTRISIKTPAGTSLAPIISGTTSSSFSIADNNAVEVVVTSPDGVTKQTYVLSIQSDESGNNLSTALFSYYSTVSTLVPFEGQAGLSVPTPNASYPASNTSWLDGKNPMGNNAASPAVQNLVSLQSFSYLNTIPNASFGLSVYLAAVDSGATVSIGDITMPVNGTFLIPYSSLTQGAANVITCKCTSSTGVVRPYTFSIWLAGSDVAPNTSGKLANISFNASQAVFDPDTLFSPTIITTNTSLDFSINTAGLTPYIVYVAPNINQVTLNLTYTDLGSRFATSYTGPLNTGNLNVNTTTDNWTVQNPRSPLISSITSGTLTPGTNNYLLIASHLPGSTVYYGYYIQFVTPQASLNSISLASTSTGAYINLNPSFTSINESYTSYIGTAVAPTSFVNLNTVFTTVTGGFNGVDYLVVNSTPAANPVTTAYNTNQRLVSNSSLTVSLKASPTDSVLPSYKVYVRMWSGIGTTPVLLGFYTLNLLNIDQTLLLTNLAVYDQQIPNSSSGIDIFPTPEIAAGNKLVPLNNPFNPSVFVYNAPISLLYGAIQPTVANPSVKSITITLNNGNPTPVASGSYYRFKITSRNIAIQITITDNLSPSNSNSYIVFIYSNSSNLKLSLANFKDIRNSDFNSPLPNGTTITAAIDPTGSYVCSNAAVSTTKFTGTPEQTGTSMWLGKPTGFELLIPGVPSSDISLIPNSAVVTKIWMYGTNNTSTGNFNFSITQVPDTNSYLSNMVLTNCTNFVFNPTTQTYTGIKLTTPNTSFSFTATSASSNASITYSFNSSTPILVPSGNQITLLATNYLPNGLNNLVINVTPQTGVVRSYTFTISRDANYYLSNLRVYTSSIIATGSTTTSIGGAVLINPSPFNPLFYTYSSEVGPTIDTAYVVLSKSPESTITMTGASIFGLNTSGEQVWAVPVQVTTTPQNTLVYSINPSAITVSAGGNSSVYNLAIVRKYPVATARTISLSAGGIPIPLRNQLGVDTQYNSLVFTYTINPVFSGPLLVSIIGQGANTYNVNGITYYDPINTVIDVTHPVVIGVDNNDGSKSLYQFSLL